MKAFITAIAMALFTTASVAANIQKNTAGEQDRAHPLTEWLNTVERADLRSSCDISCTDPETGDTSSCSIECEVGHSANCYCNDNTPTCTCY